MITQDEKIKLLIQNLYDTISNISDTRELLSQNETTKQYLEDFDNLQDTYQKDLSAKQANQHYEIAVNFEQIISISAYLQGFQAGIKTIKTLEDKNFALNMMNLLV